MYPRINFINSGHKNCDIHKLVIHKNIAKFKTLLIYVEQMNILNFQNSPELMLMPTKVLINTSFFTLYTTLGSEWY